MQNLVGNVSTAARLLPRLDGEALMIKRGKGACLWDIHDRRYIDTAMGFGAVLVGHAEDSINDALIDALRDGANLSWSHRREHEAASLLAACTGELNKVIFVNSGSEAVHLACRAARAFTGKSRIAKAAGGFDGWFDGVTLGNVKTPEAAFAHRDARPSEGGFTLFRYNDADDLERLFAAHDDIAAVLIEPVLANAGCIQPAEGYLERVRNTAHRHGALLICDEVLMGFRLHPGLTSHRMGIRPDIATVGKAIGNGAPVAAVVSTADIFESFEQNRTLRGGTYSGNPLAAQAVMTTINTLRVADYDALMQRGARLMAGIKAAFSREGVAVCFSGYGNVFTLWPGERVPDTYLASQQIADADFSRALHLALRREGVLTMPSPWGRMFLSFRHSDDIIAEMLPAFERAAASLAASGRPAP